MLTVTPWGSDKGHLALGMSLPAVVMLYYILWYGHLRTIELVQDKMAALLVANTLLWPMARFMNDKFVPQQHRVTANHIITVCDLSHA